jgi:hypothetical protein
MSNDSETSLLVGLKRNDSRSCLPRNDGLGDFEMASSKKYQLQSGYSRFFLNQF